MIHVFQSGQRIGTIERPARKATTVQLRTRPVQPCTPFVVRFMVSNLTGGDIINLPPDLHWSLFPEIVPSPFVGGYHHLNHNPVNPLTNHGARE